MNKQLRNTIVLLATTLLAGISQAAPSDFLGTWRNINSNTKGIVHVVIGPGMQIRNFGACTPNPCDMGAVPLVTYGTSVQDANHRFGTAQYNLSFKKVVVTAKLQNRNILILEHYNQFTDNSGRQNYVLTERLRKVSADPVTPLDFQNDEPLD